jgi:hypothetical protein
MKFVALFLVEILMAVIGIWITIRNDPNVGVISPDQQRRRLSLLSSLYSRLRPDLVQTARSRSARNPDQP